MNQSKKNIQNIHLQLLCLTLFLVLPLLPGYRCKAETYYYNVTDLGANGTDKKLDTDAIQEALDMASEDNFIIVTVPDGTYYLDDTLYIHSNTELRLSKNAVITRKAPYYLDNPMLCNSDKDYNMNKVGGYDLSHDITITGGTWDGGNINKADDGSNLIYLGHARNITISNTTIKNCYGSHAIELTGVKDSVIRNCYITGFRYAPNKFTAEAIQLDICHSDWSPRYLVNKSDKTECKNIIIENNTIVDYPRGIGIHHTLSGHEVTDIIIRNNTFKRSSASTQGKSVVGVFLLGAKNVTVTKNVFDYYSYGAMVKQSKNIKINKNQFRYNGIRSLTIEGSTTNLSNGIHSFLVTQDDIGKKRFVFTCGKIKSGKIKTSGKTYKFNTKKGKVTIKLKNKIKSNQRVNFYGKDTANNKYYRNYYVPKSSK